MSHSATSQYGRCLLSAGRVLWRPEAVRTARMDALEFKELRYFVSLARTRNYSATAREFAVTQSTITRNIRKLEDTLGAQLLVRHGRGVVPTAVGSKLVSRLEAVRRLLMSVTDEGHTDTLVRSSRLSLALSPRQIRWLHQNFWTLPSAS